MAWTLRFTEFFARQWNSLSDKEKSIVEEKIRLVKQNPFRYGRLRNFRFVIKVKLEVKNNYSRLMYAAYFPDKSHITVLGIFSRKNAYRDFKSFFKKLEKV